MPDMFAPLGKSGHLEYDRFNSLSLQKVMLDMFALLLKSERHVKRCISSYFDLKTYITNYRGYVDHSRRAVHAPDDV